MPEFSVDPEAVRTVANQVNNAATSIESELGGIRSQINSLQGDWQGRAAEGLQALFERWDRDARDLNNTLVQISGQMTGAAADYEGSDDSAQRRFAG